MQRNGWHALNDRKQIAMGTLGTGGEMLAGQAIAQSGMFGVQK